MTGHMLGATGAAGGHCYRALALQNSVVPPTIHYQAARPGVRPRLHPEYSPDQVPSWTMALSDQRSALAATTHVWRLDQKYNGIRREPPLVGGIEGVRAPNSPQGRMAMQGGNRMHIQDILELARSDGAKLVWTSLHVTEGALDIHMERKGSAVVEPVQPVIVPAAAVEQPAAPAAPAAGGGRKISRRFKTRPRWARPVDFNHITEVKSPMVGVFYAAPSPRRTALCEASAPRSKRETCSASSRR